MDKKSTLTYINNLTGIESEQLENILSFNDEYLEAMEKILDNKDVHRYVWNNMWLPRSMTIDREVNYDEFNNYPKFRELLKERLEAYYKVDDGEYVHKEFSSERMKYIPCCIMRDGELRSKLDDQDWESYYIIEQHEDDPYGSLLNKLNNFCVVEKDTENCVGIVAIETEYPTKMDWNISYMIAKEYRGKGYAQEAVKAIIEAAKRKHFFGINHTRYVDVYKKHNICRNIIGIVRNENIYSERVLERCGFQKSTKFNKDGCVTYIYNLK